MLHGLYINSQHVDLDVNEPYLFTYSNEDITNPQAIRNAYSKTITIQGTPANNTIFNEIYNLDSFYDTNDNTLFNPLKRAPFEIFFNGDLLESGYVQLNNIKYVKNNQIYEVTLYGLLGDFFYSLMYNDEGEELNLANLPMNDLYRLPFNVTLGNNQQQDIDSLTEPIENHSSLSEPLMLWNANYIWNSWLLSFTDKYTSTHDLIEKLLVAVPVFNGFHDDFDNDKILVRMNYPSEYDPIIPRSFTEGGNTYSTKSGYSIITTQRDMDEWETRDLRSQYLRPAIHLPRLFRYISDYSASIGYNIQFDPDISLTDSTLNTLLNQYLWKSYILLDTIDFNEEHVNMTQIDDYVNTWDSYVPDTDPHDYSSTEQQYYIKVNNSETIDLRGYTYPSLELNINDEYRPYNFINPDQLNEAQIKVNGGSLACTTALTIKDVDKFNDREQSTFGAFIYKIEILDNNVVIPEKTQVKFISCGNFTKIKNWDSTSIIYSLNNKLKEIALRYGTEDYEIINPELINGVRPNDVNHFITFKNSFRVLINDLPTHNNIKIRITKNFVNLYFQRYITVLARDYWIESCFLEPSQRLGCKYIFANILDDGTMSGYGRSRLTNAIYDSLATDFKDTFYITGEIFSGAATGTRNYNVSKNDLLANTASPFKYLVDWCKLFNMKFRTDPLTRTIYIEQYNNYYQNDIININDQIDYSKDFNIDPVYAEHDSYKFTLEKDDNNSYAQYLYKKKYGSEYSTQIVDTEYEFNNEDFNVFEDNIYNVNIDYAMTSPYYNTTLLLNRIQAPYFTLTPKYDITLWYNDESKEHTLYGLQSFNLLPNLELPLHLQCMFDKEYKTLDSMNSLVLFDKLYTLPTYEDSNITHRPFMLTDDIEIMNELNDTTPCHINAYYDNTANPYDGTNYDIMREARGNINIYNQEGRIALWTFFIPILHSSNSMFNMSYYFKQPEHSFTNEQTNVRAMYDNWWYRYENDILHKDNRVVSCHVFLKKLKPQDALRKIYWFKNSIWSLNKIEDYNYNNVNHEPTKCEFIKIYDINNYTSNEHYMPMLIIAK